MQQRGNANSRGYDYRWQQSRKLFLSAHPLCRMCGAIGRVEAATVVDHIKPHRGDPAMFWDVNNWQALCEAHHNGTKQQQERNGYANDVGEDGWPIDPLHPVNQQPEDG